MLGNQKAPVPVFPRSGSILATASVVTARAAAVHDGISFNCVLLTWSLCCTFHGLHSNAAITVGAFVIDGDDLHRSVFCSRQTDDLVEYIRCLVAALYRVPSMVVGRECFRTRMRLYSWSRVPVPF